MDFIRGVVSQQGGTKQLQADGQLTKEAAISSKYLTVLQKVAD